MAIKPIQDLKVRTLVENYVGGRSWGSWGLSFLLEIKDANGDKRNVIFDSGGNKDVLLHNIKVFKLDFSAGIDAIVLSHGHWDHTGGLMGLVETIGSVKIYAHPDAFLPSFYIPKNGKKRELNLLKEEDLKKLESLGGEIILSKKNVEVIPGLWTTGEVKREVDFEKPMDLSEGDKIVKIIDGNEVADEILDDISLWTSVNDLGKTVITGCAHAGLLNILKQIRHFSTSIKFHSLIGGTHLVGRSDEYIEKTIEGLRTYNFELLSPCHCTGFKATTTIWNAFHEEFVLNHTGRQIEIGKMPKERVF